MSERRGLTVYFTDGTHLRIDYPKQTPNEIATLLKIKELLKERELLVECEGVLLVIPFDNVKYVEAHPAPTKLPDYAIKGASVSGGGMP